MRPIHWLPPLAWMGVILLLSTEAGSAERTSRLLLPLFRWFLPSATALQLDALHGLVRKTAHVAEYAVLTFLWFRALRAGARWSPGAAAWVALATGLGWACLDEAHQIFVRSRTASPGDVVLDGVGTLAAVLVARVGWQRVADTTTAVLLWVALGGGAVLLALNTAVGVSSPGLWITTSAAALILALRRRARSRPTP
ncbi:MAG TPA: VanZ family protein [Methylomirabilota bacterium]|nr:VanZ family protein [Methylomirabilota bacterium]